MFAHSRAIKFPATWNNRAAQLRRAVELPNGKIVEFESPVGSQDEASEYLRRQAMPMFDNRDPREVGA